MAMMPTEIEQSTGADRCGKVGPAGVFFVALAFLCGALWLSAHLGIWTDEASTMATTGGGLGHAWVQAIHYELQPPLYFLLLTVWRLVSPSLLWARALSALASSGAILVTGALACRTLGRRDAALLALVLALNPWVLWAATEARVYGLVLLETALLLAAWRGRFGVASSVARRAWSRAGLVLASAGLLLTHYYGGFMLAAGLLPLALARRWRDAAEYCVLMLLVALLALPVLVHVPAQMGGHGATVGGTSLAGAIRFMGYRLETLLAPIGEGVAVLNSGGARRAIVWGVRLLALGALALGARRTWHAGGLPRREEIRWVGTVAAGMLAAFVIVRMTGPEDLVAERHSVLLVVPWLLLGFLLMTGGGRRPFAVWFSIVVASSALLDWSRLAPMAKPGDTRRVAAYLAAHARAGEVILVFRPSLAAGLAYEYRGPARIVALPEPITYRPTDRFNVAGEAIEDVEAVAARVDSATRNAGGAWLVTEPAPPYMSTNFHPERLDQIIRQRFREDEGAVFHSGVTVYSLRRR